MKTVVVRLLKPYMQMNTGEVCGVPEDQAKQLFKMKAAVEVKQTEGGVEEDPTARVNKMESGEQVRPVRRTPKAAADGN